MINKYAYRQPAAIILILVLWCASIFGSSIVTCCLPITKNDIEKLNERQIVQINISNHQVQWMNESEVRVNGVLYDVVSGDRNDKELEVIADISEQKTLNFLSELQNEDITNHKPIKQKQLLKFLPDLFFESIEVIFKLNTSQNKFCFYNNISIPFGYYNIISQPPEAIS